MDLTSRAALVQFLKSHKISPKGLVIQRGARNYAGPKCPGIGWTCTKSKRVIQLSMAPNIPNVNQFECTASTVGPQSGPNSCLIVQSSSTSDNRATCREKIGNPTGVQLCQIYQLNVSGNNVAAVMQQVRPRRGSPSSPSRRPRSASGTGPARTTRPSTRT